jgi:hypothetical protein
MYSSKRFMGESRLRREGSKSLAEEVKVGTENHTNRETGTY